MTPQQLLDFWFSPPARTHWFRSTPVFDMEVRERFLVLWQQARDGLLDAWQTSPQGALALVILLDQFPLHLFRGEAEAFATEAQSRQVADAAIASGFDSGMTAEQKAFLYLPFMHSEKLADQERSVALFERSGMKDNLRWARHHRAIVRRFGRFPHRNRALGRASSGEELAWLASDKGFDP